MADPPIQKLTELHVWIAVLGNGEERILTMRPPRGGEFTCVVPHAADAERLRPIAEKIFRASQRTSDPLARIELRSFLMVRQEASDGT